MCLGLPGRIQEVQEDGLLRQGTVDFGGTTREVCLAYVPEAGPGDWVLVHVGFAISQLDEQEAAETLAALRELEAASQERPPEVRGDAP